MRLRRRQQRLLAVLATLALLGPATAAAAAEPPAWQHMPPEGRVTYPHYYPTDDDRPNVCWRATHSPPTHRPPLVEGGYVPFLGTSVVHDSQLLLLRLFYSLDFPVKHFVVVAGTDSLGRLIGTELNHLLHYAPATNVLVMTCRHTPSAAEAWNAVMQAFPREPWGVYAARDTAFEPGSLALLARAMWYASRVPPAAAWPPAASGGQAAASAPGDGGGHGVPPALDVALMNFTNMNSTDGAFNAFAMTRRAIDRFGLFDEAIFPAMWEDRDFQVRAARMQPPLAVVTLSDVTLIHGSRNDSTYTSGTNVEGDPGAHEAEKAHSALAGERFLVNGNYFARKWGCSGERQLAFPSLSSCKFATPFNQDVPVWAWRASRAQRERDMHLKLIKELSSPPRLLDAEGRLVFECPDHYAGWAGYEEPTGVCRVTGALGRVGRTASGTAVCV